MSTPTEREKAIDKIDRATRHLGLEALEDTARRLGFHAQSAKLTDDVVNEVSQMPGMNELVYWAICNELDDAEIGHSDAIHDNVVENLTDEQKSALEGVVYRVFGYRPY